MRRFYLVCLTLAATAVVLFGCKTLEPLAQKVTERDHETYENPGLTSISAGAIKIAFLNDNSTIDTRDRNERLRDSIFKAHKRGTDRDMDKLLLSGFSAQLDRTVDVVPKLERLPAWKLKDVPREPNGELKIKDLSKIDVPDADLVIVYRLYAYSMEKVGESTDYFSPGKAKAEAAYAGLTTFKIVLVDMKTRKIASRILSGQSVLESAISNPLAEESQEALVGASRMAAKLLCRMVLERYSPPSVVATRGSGQFAMIDMGADLGVQDGDAIKFFTYVDRKGVEVRQPFAEGSVVKVGDTESWVKVEHHEVADVKINHFFQIMD